MSPSVALTPEQARDVFAMATDVEDRSTVLQETLLVLARFLDSNDPCPHHSWPGRGGYVGEADLTWRTHNGQHRSECPCPACVRHQLEAREWEFRS